MVIGDMRPKEFSITVSLFFLILLSYGHRVPSCLAPVAVGFDLSADPQLLEIAVGGSGQSNINVSARGNPGPLPVSLSRSSISGVSTSFDPEPVTIVPSLGEWNSNQSVLTIGVSDSATPGTYPLIVYADFGLVVRNVTITLRIVAWERDEWESDCAAVGGYILGDGQPESFGRSAFAAVIICESIAGVFYLASPKLRDRRARHA